jgi:hypothetical protein
VQTILPGKRCDCPDVVANGTPCKHERGAQDGCFVKEKWDEHWFQGLAVNLPNLKLTFSSESMGAPSVAKAAKSTGDSEDESVLGFGDEPDSSPLVTEMAVDSEDEPDCHHLATEMSVDSDNDTRTNSSLGGHVKPAAMPAAGSQVDLDNDVRTIASLQHIKPAAKPSYKYNYNSFMNDFTKLATAVQNRPQVAEAVHGTIMTLTRIAQGQETQIHKKMFYEIIKGVRAAFGAKRQIHSGISFSQVGGQQGLPISVNPGALG